MKIAKIISHAVLLLVLAALPQQFAGQAPKPATRTRVVLLGTGTPVPDPDHDAQTLDLYAKMPERLHSFVTKYHTTTEQLAALASKANPKLLVVYHTVAFRPGIAPPKFLSSISASGTSRSTEQILVDEIGSRYSGQFVIGRDLDMY